MVILMCKIGSSCIACSLAVLLILLAVANTCPVLADSFYVNPDSTCTGSCDGTGWANGWKAFSNIDWTRLNSGSNTLYLSGGASGRKYTSSLTIDHTGSGILTIRPGSASPSPDGHSGLVTISNVINLGSVGYARSLTISGETTAGAGTRNMKTGVIHAMAPAPSGFPYVNVKIMHLDINGGGGTDCSNHCIDLEADTRGYEIAYNYIHDCAGGGIYANNYIGHTDVAFGDNSIHHNTISHTNNDGALEAYYGGWDIYNNEINGWGDWANQGDCHGDSVSALLTKTRIFNNRFHDYTQEIFISLFGAPIDGLYIYNNEFYWSKSGWTEPGILLRNTNRRTTVDNFRVVNNIFNMNGDVGNIVFSMSSDDYGVTWTNSIIANNIFLPTTASNFYFGERSGQTHTYSNTDLRIYRNVYEESNPKSAWHETWHSTLSSWNTATGATGSNANKQCVTSMANKNGYDFHLQASDTCALGQGLDLAMIYGWTDMGIGWGKDKDGTSRPAGAWAIGPYESPSGQTCSQQAGTCCAAGQTCSGTTKSASGCAACCAATCQSQQTCIAGDLNCDKKVDIFDLVLVAQNYGKTSGFDARADANKDGKIDIFDLVVVAQNYGKTG